MDIFTELSVFAVVCLESDFQSVLNVITKKGMVIKCRAGHSNSTAAVQ